MALGTQHLVENGSICMYMHICKYDYSNIIMRPIVEV